MPQYIDLTHTLQNNISVHPYDERFQVYQHKFLEHDGFNDTKIEMGMHIGTHIDAPRHLTKRNKLISDYDIDKFIGRGCLLPAQGESIISFKKTYEEMIHEEDIVIIYTGYEKMYNDETYFLSHPVISEELAQFFIKRKVKMVGMDLPSPDHAPFYIHELLLLHDILIIENLKNIEKLLAFKKFEIIALPLNIKAEGAPARVVAKVF